MALKHSYFFRPISRPTSPGPIPTTAPVTPAEQASTERLPRPATKLAFTGFRRASPAPGPSHTNALTTLVQDGSYLEALSLKLSEAVSKALAQPTGPPSPHEQLSGRRPIPAGRGSQLGALIASELNAAAGNVNLRRAILRSLQRPMSVLLTNLSANLLPLISSPAFLAPPAPSVQAPSSNPTQLHALAYATFAGELIETFNDMGLGLDSDMRGDGLKAVREDLVSMVKRVVNPLAQGIKNELCPVIEALEQPPALGNGGQVAPVKGMKPVAPPHASITILQAILPVHTKALTRYATTPTAQSLVASVVICLVWRGLVAIANRTPQITPPSSPKLSPSGLKKSRTLSSTTPPTTPPAGRFTLKLPPSRPPSPPGMYGAVKPSTPAGDARVLHDLLCALPRPSPERETTRLAREAVDEAFDALSALVSLLDAVQSHALAGLNAEAAEDELERLAADLPTLIALPVLLRAFVLPEDTEDAGLRTVASMLGMQEDEYRSGCLFGFGRAEEYAAVVGNRVLDVLRGPDATVDVTHPVTGAVLEWLEGRVDEEGQQDYAKEGASSH